MHNRNGAWINLYFPTENQQTFVFKRAKISFTSIYRFQFNLVFFKCAPLKQSSLLLTFICANNSVAHVLYIQT